MIKSPILWIRTSETRGGEGTYLRPQSEGSMVGIRPNGITLAKWGDLKMEFSQSKNDTWPSLFFTQMFLRTGFYVRGGRRGWRSREQLERPWLDVSRHFFIQRITKASTDRAASCSEEGSCPKWPPWGLEIETKFGEDIQRLKLYVKSRLRSSSGDQLTGPAAQDTGQAPWQKISPTKCR